MKGKDLLEFLSTLSEEQLEKDVLVYDDTVGDYIDNVSSVGMEPTKEACIVVAYGKADKSRTDSNY